MSDGRNQDNGRNDRSRNDHSRRAREEEFVKGVLEQTSGSACGRAAGLLPDLNDGVLPDLDRQLIQAHLEHCPACRGLAVTLGWLDPLLPKMAFLEPGPAFTEQVLARTSLAAPGVAAGPVIEPGGFGPAGVMDRLGRWWEGKLLRPIFPLQIAYAATVILVLLAGTPLSPFRETPGRILQTVQAGPESFPMVGPMVAPMVEPIAGWFVESVATGPVNWIEGRSERAYLATRGQITGIWNQAELELGERAGRVAPDWKLMKSHLGSLAENLAERRLSDVGYDLHQVMKSGRRTWSLWWNELPKSESIADQP